MTMKVRSGQVRVFNAHACHGHRYLPSPVPLSGTGTMKTNSTINILWSEGDPKSIQGRQYDSKSIVHLHTKVIAFQQGKNPS